MDALLLSRIQFAFVISYHILFPAFTIGLASWLMFLEFRWLRTRDNVWWDLYQFWSKVFAISFGMGVVSGIVMSFQFGTNWSRLSERAGAVLAESARRLEGAGATALPVTALARASSPAPDGEQPAAVIAIARPDRACRITAPPRPR